MRSTLSVLPAVSVAPVPVVSSKTRARPPDASMASSRAPVPSVPPLAVMSAMDRDELTLSLKEMRSFVLLTAASSAAAGAVLSTS